MHRSGLTELEVVLAIVRQGSFRAAAKELDMSSTAVSNAIAGLESRLQARLFHRTTRSVALTERGLRFVERITPALREIRQASDEINSHAQEPAGTLRLNVPPGSIELFFDRTIIPYMQCYPRMQVEIVTQARLVDIVAEGFDAGIRLAEAVPQDMISVPVFDELRQRLVATPEYFARCGTPQTPGDLEQHAGICMRLSSGGIYHWELEYGGEAVKATIRPRLVVSDIKAMLSAVRAGLGIGFLSEPFISADLAAGRLVPVLDEWSHPYGGLRLYYPGHRHVPDGLKALVSLIRLGNDNRRISGNTRSD